MSTNKLCDDPFEPSTSPPHPPGYPRHLTVYPAQGVGNLIQVFGLVEFVCGFLHGFWDLKSFPRTGFHLCEQITRSKGALK